MADPAKKKKKKNVNRYTAHAVPRFFFLSFLTLWPIHCQRRSERPQRKRKKSKFLWLASPT
jgi:hypothetical protein